MWYLHAGLCRGVAVCICALEHELFEPGRRGCFQTATENCCILFLYCVKCDRICLHGRFSISFCCAILLLLKMFVCSTSALTLRSVCVLIFGLHLFFGVIYIFFSWKLVSQSRLMVYTLMSRAVRFQTINYLCRMKYVISYLEAAYLCLSIDEQQ